jgi:hypothetical protein
MNRPPDDTPDYVRGSIASASREPLYFEVPDGERPANELTGEWEPSCAASILRGRQLVLMPYALPPSDPGTPAVDRNFSLADASGGRLEEPEAFYDTIADILQVAEFAGWDAEDLCRVALDQQRRERSDAEAEARRRRDQSK